MLPWVVDRIVGEEFFFKPHMGEESLGVCERMLHLGCHVSGWRDSNVMPVTIKAGTAYDGSGYGTGMGNGCGSAHGQGTSPVPKNKKWRYKEGS